MTGVQRTILLLLLGPTALPLLSQIIVPDRLPDGRRMPVLTTPADRGTLSFDSIRTLPEDEGGRDSWWHRHALHLDGPVKVALDPVVDLAREARSMQTATGQTWQYGHRNVRGVRYAGSLDDKVRFGGKVLEMQRLLVGPETEYVLASQLYPGMGTGKIRPAEGGLHSIDHSLAEVWFDVQPHDRWRVQWGIGSTGLGPGARNILWQGRRAPAPYLLVEGDLGKGWTWRWVQSRQRGRERLPADGAREGRYHPLGLGIRSLTKTIERGSNRVAATVMTARWTDVLGRGEERLGVLDWMRDLAPWHLPNLHGNDSTHTPGFRTGHIGLDVQWRRPQSTWYAQVRTHPWNDGRYGQSIDTGDMQSTQWMLGHVRHGDRWTVWTEWAPVAASQPAAFDPLLPLGPLGIQDASPWRSDLIQGIEWRPGRWTLQWESGRLVETTLEDGTMTRPWSHKVAIRLPSRAADAVSPSDRVRRGKFIPNRLLPPLVPLVPVAGAMHIPALELTWWTVGISSPVSTSRKTH